VTGQARCATVRFMNVGSPIKRRREARDLTRAALATLASMPRQRIVVLESNLSSPTIRTLERVASALGTTVWQLVKEAENG
jgi:transcriptional regulator with XRE-family HTH domain